MRGWLVAAVTGCLICGCAPKESPRTSARRPSPTATPAPKLGAVMDAPELSFSDRNGDRVAQIKARFGAATGTGKSADAAGLLQNGEATLFQKNKPAATMTAASFRADQAKRTITANGNVLLKAASAPNEPVSTLRADRMVWEYDTGSVTGTGNVVLSRGAQMRIPGTAIVADTRLQTAEMTGGDAPIAGTIP